MREQSFTSSFLCRSQLEARESKASLPLSMFISDPKGLSNKGFFAPPALGWGVLVDGFEESRQLKSAQSGTVLISERTSLRKRSDAPRSLTSPLSQDIKSPMVWIPWAAMLVKSSGLGSAARSRSEARDVTEVERSRLWLGLEVVRDMFELQRCGLNQRVAAGMLNDLNHKITDFAAGSPLDCCASGHIAKVMKRSLTVP